MVSFLCDVPIRNKDDAVTKAGGRQPVGNEDGGLSRRHVAVLLVNIVFRNGVQRRRRFIQNEDRPVLIKCPRQHQPLGLAAGKEHAVQKQTVKKY